MTRRRAFLTAGVMALSIVAYVAVGGIWLAGVAVLAGSYVVLAVSR